MSARNSVIGLARCAALASLTLISTARAADLDITAFGAVPNDGLDDRDAIQDAISAASAGDRIVIPAGTFHTRFALLPKGGTAIVGAGRDNTTLEYIGSATQSESASVFRLQGSGRNNIEIAEMTIDGFGIQAGGGEARALNGIYANGTSGHILRDLRIRDIVNIEQDFSDAPGIATGIRYVGGVTGTRIENNEIMNIGVDDIRGTAIRGNSSGGHVVIGNTIDTIGRTGIHFAASPDLVIQNNTINNTGLYRGPELERFAGDGLGIEVFGGSDRSIVEDNTMDRWLSIANTSFTAVRRNTIVSPPELDERETAGLELASGTDNIFTDNIVGKRHGQSLLMVAGQDRNVERVFVGRNTFNEGDGRAAQLHDSNGRLRQLYFYDNDFINSQGLDSTSFINAGIRLLSNGNGENRPLDDRGIQDLVFESNRITGNNGHGFRSFDQLGNETLDELTFIGNTITGNAGDAFNGDRNFNNVEFADSNVVQDNNGSEASPMSNGYANNLAPTTSIVVPSVVRIGETVNITFDFSDDSGLGPGNLLWDLDEGLPLLEANPSVEFQRLGPHSITLIAWDQTGRASRSTATISVIETVAGDFNLDGVVDQGDYTVWRDSLGSNTHLPNETTTHGSVTLEDYDTWRSNFGATTHMPATIPEPCGLLLGVVFSATLFRRPSKGRPEQ